MASEQVRHSRAKRLLTWLAMALLWGMAALFLLGDLNFHTPLGIDIATLLLVTLHVKGTKLVPLSFSSYLMLFPLFVIELAAFGLHRGVMPYIPMLLFLLPLNLSALLLWQTGELKAYAIAISVTVLAACPLLLGYHLLWSGCAPAYYRLAGLHSWTALQKTVCILGVAFCYFASFTVVLRLLLWVLRRQFGGFFLRLSKKLSGIELYILMLAAFVPMVLMVLRASYYLPSGVGLFNSLQWFQIFFLLITAVYVCLLVKAITIKEKMRIVQDEKEMLSSYSEGLETNLGDMRELRHDTKNLLLTMAGFVERSDDEKMKEFYTQNIVPFMQNAIVKNELLDKLKILSDSRLKYFLYYKLMEKAEDGVLVKLCLSSSVHLETGYGDIIRLLGILIDNAAEEAKLAHGTADIKITEDAAGIGIRIGNDIRPETKARGIIPGTTDKGLGRGNGLLIARRIVRKYDNLLLNSYFTESRFVQYLLISKN